MKNIEKCIIALFPSDPCSILLGYPLGIFFKNAVSMNNMENSNVPFWLQQHFARLPRTNSAQKMFEFAMKNTQKPKVFSSFLTTIR